MPGEEAGGELRGEEQLGRRQRQIEELYILEAMFGVDEGVFYVDDPEERDLVRGVVESCGAPQSPPSFHGWGARLMCRGWQGAAVRPSATRCPCSGAVSKSPRAPQRSSLCLSRVDRLFSS